MMNVLLVKSVPPILAELYPTRMACGAPGDDRNVRMRSSRLLLVDFLQPFFAPPIETGPVTFAIQLISLAQDAF
jgi:hypothetical protein